MSEFITIWGLGGEASLNLTTRNGITTVAFNCTLGHPGAPHSLPPTSAPSPYSAPSSSSKSSSQRTRHRGPSEKERNRLRAARHQATLAMATAPVSSSPKVSASVSVTASPSPSSAPEASLTSDVVVSVASVAIHTEEPSVQYHCDQCDYVNAAEKGLRQHIRMKHRISQVDGMHDLEEECNRKGDKVTLRTGTGTSKTDDPSVKICEVCKMETSFCPLSPGCPMEKLIQARQELAALKEEIRKRGLLPGSSVTN